MLTTPEIKTLQFVGIVPQANLEMAFAPSSLMPVSGSRMSVGTHEFDNPLCTALSKRANTKRPSRDQWSLPDTANLTRVATKRYLGKDIWLMKRVGILVGREKTFPEALIRNIDERGNG